MNFGIALIHYNPFGLTMAGISSTAAGKLENKKSLYNEYELNTDFNINLYEAFYRTNDPQLGRFWQLDPSPIVSNSLYSAMNNNPILFNDLLGDTAKFDTKTQVMVDKFIKQTILNNKGKEIKNKNYKAAFAGLISRIDKQSTIDGYNVNYKFNGEAPEGGVSSDGIDINVTINDPGETFGGGSDGILFEETKHVDQFLDGKTIFVSDNNSKFSLATSNVQNEVDAKQFAIDNLPINNTYTNNQGYYIPTDLGYLKNYCKTNEQKVNFLRSGVENFNVTGRDTYGQIMTSSTNLRGLYSKYPNSSVNNPLRAFTRNKDYFGYPISH